MFRFCLRILLLALSVAVSGYDVVLSAVDCVESRDYFATPIVIVFVAVISFFIGFGFFALGVAFNVIYQRRKKASPITFEIIQIRES